MGPIAWQPKQPTVSTICLPAAALPLVRPAGNSLGLDFDHRYSAMALISAAFRLSQYGLPLLLEFHQNCGIRAWDLKSFGLASHFRTQSLVSFPETVERSGPTLRIFS